MCNKRLLGGLMKNRLKREISIIGVPLDMGASQLGTRLGPEAIRIAGLDRKSVV